MVKTVLKIDGMMCSMCESHVNDAIRNAMPVKKVTSSHAKGTTELLTEETPDAEQLKAVIAKTGYTLLSVKSTPCYKKHFSLFGKS